MAAVYRTSATGGSTSGTSNRTATITPAVGDLLIVVCSVAANTSTPTCSDGNGGGTYDLIGGAAIAYDDGGGTPINHRLAVFVRTSLMVNTTSTVATVATGSNTAGIVHVVAVSGMFLAGSAAVRQFASQTNQAAGTPAPAFSGACLTSNVSIGVVANCATGASMTTPTGWTERQDTGFSSDPVGCEVVTRDSGFTGTTVTWGSASATKFASFILELNGGGFTGTGSIATAPLALAGSAAETFSSIATAALAPLALAVAGAESFTGTATAAVAPLAHGAAGVANAATPITGAAGFAAAPLALADVGTYSPLGVTGTSAVAAAPLALAGVAIEAFNGSVGFALAPLDLTIGGTYSPLAVTGAGAAAVAPLAYGVNATETFTGTATLAPAPLVYGAVGVHTNDKIGTVAFGLSPLALTDDGTYTPVAISGTGAAALAPVILDAAGAYVPASATGAVGFGLVPMSYGTAGELYFTGMVGFAAASLAYEAAGAAILPVVGVVDFVLAPLRTVASADLGFIGAGTTAVPPLAFYVGQPPDIGGSASFALAPLAYHAADGSRAPVTRTSRVIVTTPKSSIRHDGGGH